VPRGEGAPTCTHWHWHQESHSIAGMARIIPPGTCHLSITQDTSLTWHHLKETACLSDP